MKCVVFNDLTTTASSQFSLWGDRIAFATALSWLRHYSVTPPSALHSVGNKHIIYYVTYLDPTFIHYIITLLNISFLGTICKGKIKKKGKKKRIIKCYV